MPSTSVQMTSSSASTTWAMMAPEKIGAIAAEGGDAAIGSCADEPGYDWDDAGFEERKKNVAAALLGLFEMRLGVTKSIASQDELGGRDGHRGNAGLFESGGKEPSAETFTKGG